MSSSTSSSRLFLASLAVGLVLTGTAFSLADERYLHTGPEFGMAMSLEGRIEAACESKATPDLVIVGDSRAVAGVSAQAIGAAGVDVQKFAMGGSGLFFGWAVLDRLLDCGVRPKEIVLAYGVIHLIDSGAVMERTTNFDSLKGPTASRAYAALGEWEPRLLRAMAYKAISVAGAEATLIDLILLRPSLRSVLESPRKLYEQYYGANWARDGFDRDRGDAFYGTIGLKNYTETAPEEIKHPGGVNQLNIKVVEAVGDLVRAYDIPTRLYILPMSETAMTVVPASVYDDARSVRGLFEQAGVAPMNDIWSLPDADFGDPSHVNEAGRARVTDDFLARYKGEAAD